MRAPPLYELHGWNGLGSRFLASIIHFILKWLIKKKFGLWLKLEAPPRFLNEKDT
jgi:hypothetical protein